MPFFIEINSPDIGAISGDEVIISYIKKAKSGGKEVKISNIGVK